MAPHTQSVTYWLLWWSYCVPYGSVLTNSMQTPSVETSATGTFLGCLPNKKKENVCFWHVLLVCKHISRLLADILERSQPTLSFINFSLSLIFLVLPQGMEKKRIKSICIKLYRNDNYQVLSQNVTLTLTVLSQNVIIK